MPATPHQFQGEHLLLDPAGLLIWPAQSLLAVADLHLEKGSAAASQGQLVPPWDTTNTLARLAAAIVLYRPTTIVAVGDSFHDAHAATRLSVADHAVLTALTHCARFIWIHGNHDPHPPEGLSGHYAQTFVAGPITFRHQTDPGTQGEISGHFHPKARVQTRATTIARPCFMADPCRIILPSFGAYTGGLDILTPAITQHFPRGGQAFLLGQTRLFTFAVPAPKPLPAPKRVPATDKRAPASDKRAPASDKRAPATDERAPATDERAPASDKHVPAPELATAARPHKSD